MRKNVLIALVAITLCSGTIGYLISGSEFYMAVISSFPMLRIGNPAAPTNVFIEIARWAGILFALNVLYAVVEAAVRLSAADLKIAKKLRRPDAVAVHGDGVFADKLAETMPDNTIQSDRKKAFQAPCQVLLFSSDQKAIEFYDQHAASLKAAKEVYIDLNSVLPDARGKGNIYTFSMADICAELYWEEHPVYSAEKIALVGEGVYAEALLTQGLNTNLFSVEGGVEYLVFGDFGRYRNLHRHLDEALSVNGDELRFFDEPWHGFLGELESCDRIVLCGESEQNVETAVQLRFAGIKAPLHVRCDDALSIILLDSESMAVFGTAEQLCSSAIILQQKQRNAGKICDIAYRFGTAGCDSCTRQRAFPKATIGDAADGREIEALKTERLKAADFDVCLSCPAFRAAWRDMDEFTKSSNYAAAAHDHQKIRLLREHGASPDVTFDELPQDVVDELREIEHIRWCRFHYMNNWSYAPDGKDRANLTHHYLVPYDDLSSAVKANDGDAYSTVWLRRKDVIGKGR